MAKEYIERDALLRDIEESVVFSVARGEPSAEMRGANKIVDRIKNVPAADVVEVPKTGIGDLSDGYHTFNELYHHRAVLFAAMCNTYPHLAWKSKKHDTGDMFEGMFIVGIETPEGQATYHYDVDPYWDMFHVKELNRAPVWDGHTPDEAIRRISTIEAELVKRGRWKLHDDGSGTCDQCGFTQKHIWDDDNWQNYCGVCGADMRELNGAIPNMSPATKKLYDDVMESLTREDGDNNAQTD